jgi:hypothetical protein
MFTPMPGAHKHNQRIPYVTAEHVMEVKMHNHFDSLLTESIKLELKVAGLYSLFHNLFPEDADFWWKLMMEEQSHASLLQSLEDFFAPAGLSPTGLLAPVVQDLKDVNSTLSYLTERCRHARTSREEAFNIALEVEQSADEFHFQEFMASDAHSKIDEVFIQLNGDDKDHARRIGLYMTNHGIRSRSENFA